MLVAADVQEGVPVVFDSYEKEDGTRKSRYGRYGKLKLDSRSTEHQRNNDDNKGFEYVVRYEDGIHADFVIASCSVPVNYDYTRLDVENYSVVGEDNNGVVASSDDNFSNGSKSVRFFWDGGPNTPLSETVVAHRDYWYRVRKLEDNIPRLKFGIINLHQVKQEAIPYDHDRVIDRKNDIIYHDKTEFDEYMTVLISDYAILAKSIIKLAEENGVSKKKLQQTI